ncbi:hypothetical protein HGT70_14530 [Rosenbergiella collisarenosi]|uniref:hypothetical protein n=1 Tax=Rosenbergiella collisarenosi TaxID=1544695 RepID=UPI001BDAF411|nr:hypothetical protein [Rosenbergiella collisarenosi]MBT0722488.1 hypothetical protein [Rosenbergiella collisarenosi]
MSKKLRCTVLTIAMSVGMSSAFAVGSTTTTGDINTGELNKYKIHEIDDQNGFVYNYMRSNSESVSESDADYILIGQDINVNTTNINKIKTYLSQGKKVIFDGLSTGSSASKTAMSVMKNSIQADAVMFSGSLEDKNLAMTPIISNANNYDIKKLDTEERPQNNNTVENIFSQ